MVVVAHAIGVAIFVALAGVVLRIPIRQLWVPYTTLVYCGLVLAPLIYWTRSSRDRPNSCSLRFGVSIFIYIQCLTLALGFSAIRTGLLSQEAAINFYAAPIFALSLIVSVFLFYATRQMLRGHRTN